jgi:hypothetical protein
MDPPPRRVSCFLGLVNSSFRRQIAGTQHQTPAKVNKPFPVRPAHAGKYQLAVFGDSRQTAAEYHARSISSFVCMPLRNLVTLCGISVCCASPRPAAKDTYLGDAVAGPGRLRQERRCAPWRRALLQFSGKLFLGRTTGNQTRGQYQQGQAGGRDRGPDQTVDCS